MAIDYSKAKHWVKSAVTHKGSLTASARRVNMSPMAFAEKHKSDKGKTGARSRLALTLRKMS